MDSYNIDSHKLMYHPKEVGNWLVGNIIQPIYMEVSTSGACNHRCKFCALDYLGYKSNYLSVASYVEFLMRQDGLKSVMFGGEGEPLMHKHFTDIVAATFTRGIDCGLTTNGVLLTPTRTNFVRMMKWIKISVDAGTKETYSQVHGCSERDWNTLWRNIDFLTKNKSKCKIGLQFLLLEDNKSTAWDFLWMAAGTRVDYVVFKQYSQNLNSKNEQVNVYLHPDEIHDMRKRFSFDIIVREDRAERGYQKCLALPFWRYLQANGDLWACSAHLGDERFLLDNIANRNFEQNSNISEIHIDNMMETFNISNCRLNCRMNNCNEYLNRLKNPQEHDNFI